MHADPSLSPTRPGSSTHTSSVLPSTVPQPRLPSPSTSDAVPIPIPDVNADVEVNTDVEAAPRRYPNTRLLMRKGHFSFLFCFPFPYYAFTFCFEGSVLLSGANYNLLSVIFFLL
jgi:hypothetical protein